MRPSAANPTSAPPLKKSPYSQRRELQPPQAKAFNRAVGAPRDNIAPEVVSQIHLLFNNQLPAANVPLSHAKALRDYVIVQLNNYLALTLQQPTLAIADLTDSASDISDQDSSSSPPSTETGTHSSSSDSMALVDAENCQQDLCRQLMNLKAAVTSGKLGLDNDKIKRYLKQQLSKKAYQGFKSIFKKQPKTEKTDSVDTTSRIINTVLIIGPEIYQCFFNALTDCGYHGLFQSEIHSRQKSQNLNPFPGRNNSLPDRFRQRHFQPLMSQWPLSPVLSGYTGVDHHRNNPHSHAHATAESRNVIPPSDDPSVIPIRINRKVPVTPAKSPLLQSFRPAPPPREEHEEIASTGQLTANAVAAEVLRRDFVLAKTSSLRGSGSRFLPPPPADWVIEEEPEDN